MGRSGNRWCGRAAVSLVLIVCGTMAMAGVADAKKKKGKQKLGPLVTRSASTTASGNGQIATATAACPKKTRAFGGGFATTPVSTALISAVYESQKIGQKAWRASAQLVDGGPPDTANLTAHVYCRRGAPSTKTSALTVPTPPVVQIGPDATANCPPGQKALAGGFATTPPGSGGSISTLMLDSLRSGTGGWLSRVVSSLSSSLTSFAYCAKQKKAPPPATAASPPNTTSITASTATASCGGKRVALAGGFSQTGADVSGNVFFYVYESQGAGRDWRVSGIRSGASGAPVTLSSTAYCG